MAENNDIQQTTQTVEPVKKAKKRRCCKIAGITSAVIFTPILLLLAVLATSSGQQNVIQLVDKYMDPLSIGSVSGSLQQGLVLNQVKYQSTGIDTQIEQARLHLNFSCLWQKGICVEDLSLKQPNIKIDTALLPPSEPEQSESTPMQRIELPITLDIKNVAVDNLSLNIDKTALTLGHFQTGASLNNEQGLTLIPTQINDVKLSLVSEPEPEKKTQTDNKPTDWAAIEKSLTPALLKELKTVELPFDIHIQGISAQHWQYRHLQGKQEQVIDIPQIQLQADATGARVELQKLLIESNLAKLQGQGQIQLSESFPLNLQLQSDIAQINGEDKQLILPKSALDLSLSGDLLKQTQLVLKTQGGINAELEGKVELNQEKTPLNLRLTSKQVKYPFEVKDKNEQINLQNLDLTVKGDLLNYQAKLAGFVEGMGIPPAQVGLNAKGGLTHAQIQHLKINALEGEANLAGQLNWQEGIAWQSDVALNGIDTKTLLQDWPAVLSGKISTTGQAGEKGWLLKIPMLDVNGTVSKLPLTLTGNLEASDKTLLKVNNLALNYGVNKVNAQGILGDNSDFNLDIHAPNLSGLLPDLKANVMGKVNLTGKLTQPTLDLDLKGDHLQFQQLLLNKLSAKGNVVTQQDELKANVNVNLGDFRYGDIKLGKTDLALTGAGSLKDNFAKPNVNLELTSNNIQFQDMHLKKVYAKTNIVAQQQIGGRLDLNLTDFRQGEIQIPKTDLWLTGNEQNHELHLRMNGEPVAATLNLFGNFDRTSQSWKGILNQTEFKTPVGVFKNNQNVNISYDNKNTMAMVSSHCWNGVNLDLCLPQQFSAGAEGAVPFEIRKLNLEMVNKILEQDLLKGQLNSKGKVAWFKNKPLALDVMVEGNNLALKQKIDYRTFNLAIPKLMIDSQLANNNLNVKSDIQVQGQGRLSSELKLQDIATSRKLSGSLNIQNLGLDLANQLLGKGERLNGKIGADLRFAGDLESPRLHGSFNVNNIRAKMYSMPFDIQNGDIKMQFSGNRSTLLGNIQTDDSRLDITGDASWQDLKRWQANVRAKANDFKVDIPQIAKIKVSPNVEMQATPTQLTLSGVVNIPWARILVESLPESAVTVSSDEVILDAPVKHSRINKTEVQPPAIKPAKSADGMAIKSDLKINVGDDVRLEAYGLKTNLDGLLSVRQSKGNLGIFGQVYLKNGRYASFGQDLLIRKGEISFSGSPSQPFLNIEAIRNPEAMEDSKVTAGVKVTGLAETPEVEIFAEPSMPQDQALAYILTGRALDSGDAGSSGAVGAALLGLGLSKSGKLVGGIGEKFGISDLNVGTQGVGNNSKVVVSGQVTPRLQVKYGVGLFDGLAELTLRYKLIPQLFLQSVSGASQALDLLYEFEF